MRIFTAFACCLLLSLSVARSQIPVVAGDSLVLIEQGLKKIHGNVNFTVIPGPVYGATQKLGFMVLPMLVYNLRSDDKLSPPSSTALGIYFDFYGSWQVAAKQSLYWNRNRWRAFANAGLGSMHTRFFGIGRDTVIVGNDAADYSWIRTSSVSFSTSCYRRIFSGLFGGLEYTWYQSRPVADDSAGTEHLSRSGITPGELINESILVPAFVWDNRDNIFWSTRGYYADLSFQLSNQVFFSSKNYGVLSLQVNGYHRLLRGSDRLSLAWHFFLQSGFGELPFTRYASYGSGDNVTGYTHGKYIDKSEITVQAELRYDLWKFIAAGGYAGTGKLFPSFDVIGQSVWLHYGGLRVYVNILPSRNIRLRLDVALARSDAGFYVGIGQGF